MKALGVEMRTLIFLLIILTGSSIYAENHSSDEVVAFKLKCTKNESIIFEKEPFDDDFNKFDEFYVQIESLKNRLLNQYQNTLVISYDGERKVFPLSRRAWSDVTISRESREDEIIIQGQPPFNPSFIEILSSRYGDHGMLTLANVFSPKMGLIKSEMGIWEGYIINFSVMSAITCSEEENYLPWVLKNLYWQGLQDRVDYPADNQNLNTDYITGLNRQLKLYLDDRVSEEIVNMDWKTGRVKLLLNAEVSEYAPETSIARTITILSSSGSSDFDAFVFEKLSGYFRIKNIPVQLQTNEVQFEFEYDVNNIGEWHPNSPFK